MMIRSGWWAATPVVLALAACQPHAEKPAQIEAGDAWARATAPGQETGGVFLSLRNGGGVEDRLIAATTPVARSVEIHSMTMEGEIMRMRRQPDVGIAAASSVKLGPGGTHLMLMGLGSPLMAGTSFPLTLQFANAGQQQVEVRVRPIGSTGPRDGADE